MTSAVRNTKIIATLGPASNTEAIIESLVKAGANLFRLNFSHGTYEEHTTRYNIIRALEEKHQKTLGIIADLQGPKLRIGKFEKGEIALKKGQEFRFDINEDKGNNTRVQLPHKEAYTTLKKGGKVYLDDGRVRMEVIDKNTDYLICRVITGARLSDHKGVNLPDTLLPIPALTQKDKRDLEFALDLGVDWIAQSFVQTPDDVAQAKQLIHKRAGLIAKIEKPSALDHFEEICALADGVMIARGDLGVEIPPEDIPSLQKRLVRYTRWQAKPVIVATQMLESMMTTPTPTRAEASDVATAIYDGTDAVMLSGETAAGTYPVESVEMMTRIAESVEADPLYRSLMNADHPIIADTDVSDAITVAAENLAEDIHASLIVSYTTSGTTALRTARQRPQMPILCLTQNKNVSRRLSLSYAVNAVHSPDINALDDIVHQASVMAKYFDLAKTGDTAVLTAGSPFGQSGTTNTIRAFKIT